MDEFLRINWRTANDLRTLEHQNQFISEEVIAESIVFKSFEEKSFFGPLKKKIKNEVVISKADEIDTLTKSRLDRWAQEQCLKALKVFQSGKNPSSYTKSEQLSVDTFTKFKSCIMQENSLYQNYVHGQWYKFNMGFLSKKVLTLMPYGRDIWEAKLKRKTLFAQYYKEMNININMTFNEDESIIDYKCSSNVLDLGSVAKFLHPIVNSAFPLDTKLLPGAENTQGVYSNLSVSEDVNVKAILENRNDIDLVVPLSTLKCIANGSDPKKKWIIPFHVKAVPVHKDNCESTKKVVFLDKPFSQFEVTYQDLTKIAYKRVIKSNFCQIQAFEYDTPIDAGKCKNGFDEESSGDDSKSEKLRPSILHRNVSYKLWNIKKTHCQNNMLKSNHKNVEFNILVRSKLDACECTEQGTLQPVILRPKLESQLKFGARIASKEELANDWTTLFFTPFSNLYRMGISTNQFDLVYVEKCHIQKIAAEAQTHYQFKPNLGLGILEQTFEALIALEPGNYLLQHLPKHGAFIRVLKETSNIDCKPGEVFDFYTEFEKLSVSATSKNWVPIDVNFILPSYDAINRMPGMFMPRVKPKLLKFGRKTKKKPPQKLNSSC